MIDKVGDLFGKRASIPKRTRHTERGDLFDIFLSRLNPPRATKGLRPMSYGRLSYLLTGIPTADLYALLSRCNDAERRGVAWGAAFWTEIKPNNPNE
jgi:hypothetical protein